MGIKTREKKIQRNLTILGITYIGIALFLGPLGIVPLVGAAGIFIGKPLRRRRFRDQIRKEEYEEESSNSLVPEQTETAIARREPKLSKKVLENLAQNEVYK